jgi:hypothetical protein
MTIKSGLLLVVCHLYFISLQDKITFWSYLGLLPYEEKHFYNIVCSFLACGLWS